MKAKIPVSAAVWIALTVGTAVGTAKDAGPPASDERAPCVLVSTATPYGNAGYDHVVLLRNRCDTAHVCKVRTNVNPDSITVSVPAKQTVRVVTWRGSPARTFSAEAKCRPVSP